MVARCTRWQFVAGDAHAVRRHQVLPYYATPIRWRPARSWRTIAPGPGRTRHRTTCCHRRPNTNPSQPVAHGHTPTVGPSACLRTQSSAGTSRPPRGRSSTSTIRDDMSCLVSGRSPAALNLAPPRSMNWRQPEVSTWIAEAAALSSITRPNTVPTPWRRLSISNGHQRQIAMSGPSCRAGGRHCCATRRRSAGRHVECLPNGTRRDGHEADVVGTGTRRN